MSFPEHLEKLHQSGTLTDGDMEKLSALKEQFIEKLGEGPRAITEFIKSELSEGSEMSEDTFDKIAEAFEKAGGAADIAPAIAGAGKKSVGELMRGMLPWLTLGAAASVPVLHGAGWLSRRHKVKNSLSAIMKANPELKGDPNVMQHWNVLTDYAPDIAANPTVAGTLLRRMKNWGEVDHQTVKDLISMQKDINQGQLGYGGPMDAGKAIGGVGKAFAGSY